MTFAAEALVGLVARYGGERRLCLVDLTDADITENIAAAAERMQVPVTIWQGHRVQVLGVPPGSGARHALAFALARPQVRAADYAAAAGLSITNASSRLNRLWSSGCLLRRAGSASSGGAEYVYRPIG